MTKLVRTMAKDLAAIGHRPAAQVVFAGLAMAFILYAIPSHAQRRNEARPSEARQSEEWVLLGSQEVDRTRNRERIDLRTSRGRVKSVRLIAKHGELELSQVRVTYVDGRVHAESRTINMNPNDRTRPIDSSGNEAFVDEVELTIRPARGTRGADRTMTIEVWGLQTSAGARAERPTPVSPTPAASAAVAPPTPTTTPSPQSTPTPPAALSAPQSEQRRHPAPTVQTAPPVAAQLPSLPLPPAPVPPAVPAADASRPLVPSPSPVQSSPAPAPATLPPLVSGPPGSAPPLPPSRGPQDRVAAVQRTPTPTPVPPLRPGIGDETSDGIFLGRRTLNPAAEQDSVPIGFEIARLSKLRMRVLDAGLRLDDIKIHYVSGQPDVVAVNADLAANNRTAWLPVAGDRAVRDIEVSYHRRDGARNAATIEIYGEHGDGYLDPGGEGARLARYSGWVPLAAKTTALRIGFDHLEFQIGRNKGGFKKLRVDAKDRAITLREVRVVYATGEDEIFTIDSSRQRIAAGASFGPIDLRGSSRPIRSLILKTRSRFLDSEARGKDAAIVEVWGQH